MTRSGASMQANCQHEGEEDWWEEEELGCQEQPKIDSPLATSILLCTKQRCCMYSDQSFSDVEVPK